MANNSLQQSPNSDNPNVVHIGPQVWRKEYRAGFVWPYLLIREGGIHQTIIPFATDEQRDEFITRWAKAVK
jgi:hypothetical protein